MSDIFGGMFDEFSIAYVEMLEAKSRLWKRAAKKWYRQALSWQAWGKAHEADADRRGELLRRSKDYLDEWFTWLEENTAKDIDDLMELSLEIEKELDDD